MEKIFYILPGLLLISLIVNPATGEAQNYNQGMSRGSGHRMMEEEETFAVPSKLPAPVNPEWIQRLGNVLNNEEQSLAQYELDQAEFNAYRPYMAIIPQKEYHIQWIEEMFKAYNLAPGEKTFDTKPAKSITEAYKQSVKREEELVPEYEWLVKNAEDRESAHILNNILLQTRWNLARFEHASKMGESYGYGMSRQRGTMMDESRTRRTRSSESRSNNKQE